MSFYLFSTQSYFPIIEKFLEFKKIDRIIIEVCVFQEN